MNNNIHNVFFLFVLFIKLNIILIFIFKPFFTFLTVSLKFKKKIVSFKKNHLALILFMKLKKKDDYQHLKSGTQASFFLYSYRRTFNLHYYYLNAFYF